MMHFKVFIIELCAWKSLSSPGLLSAVPWQGFRGSGVSCLQLSGNSPFKYFTRTPLTYPTSSVASERCPTRWKLASVLVCRATKVKCLRETRCWDANSPPWSEKAALCSIKQKMQVVWNSSGFASCFECD